MNRLHNSEWCSDYIYLPFFTPLFCLFTFYLNFLSSVRSLKKIHNKNNRVLCLQLPPIPHFSLAPFCTATHIHWTGLYIVFEMISGCLCLHLLLNKCVGLLPAYLCVWMSVMTTIVCASGCAQIHSLYVCDNEWEIRSCLCAHVWMRVCIFTHLCVCISMDVCVSCVCTQ